MKERGGGRREKCECREWCKGGRDERREEIHQVGGREGGRACVGVGQVSVEVAEAGRDISGTENERQEDMAEAWREEGKEGGGKSGEVDIEEHDGGRMDREAGEWKEAGREGGKNREAGWKEGGREGGRGGGRGRTSLFLSRGSTRQGGSCPGRLNDRPGSTQWHPFLEDDEVTLARA